MEASFARLSERTTNTTNTIYSTTQYDSYSATRPTGIQGSATRALARSRRGAESTERSIAGPERERSEASCATGGDRPIYGPCAFSASTLPG